MGRKWNPESVPNDLLLPHGTMLFEIDEIEEAEINGKLVYKPALTVTEPKAYKGKKLFGVTYWIGTDDDKDAQDPETWAASRGAVDLKKLISMSGVKPTRDIDEDRQAAAGRIVGITVGKKVRKNDPGREDNVALDYWKPGTRAVEIFDEGKKASGPGPLQVRDVKPARALPPAGRRFPMAEEPDFDDDDPTVEAVEVPSKTEPPKRSTEGEIPKPGKPKKADMKSCPKCEEEFPRSQLAAHIMACAQDDDDDDTDDDE